MTRTPPHIVTLVALSGIAALSMNVFLPSLPGMARDFGVDYGLMQLSVSAYLAACAILQLIVGPISDRYGRRPVMLVALVVFLLATLGTLLAPDAYTFLIFRMAQAAIVAGLALSRAVVRDMVAGDKAASMIGYVTMGMAVVPMIAPIIGGILDEAFGWRANFIFLGVAGVLVLIWTWHDMGETVQGDGVSLREQLANYPALARSVRFWGYTMSATFTSGAFFAYLGGAPFVGESVFGLSSAEVGYYFAAPSVGYLLGNYMAAKFSISLGMNKMILIGSWITALALVVSLMVDLAGIHEPVIFFGAIAFMGLGNGVVMPNANAGIMSVRPELAGSASGFGGAMMVGGGAALAALSGALLQPGSGAAPLLVVMALSALASLVAIYSVLRREKLLALRDLL